MNKIISNLENLDDIQDDFDRLEQAHARHGILMQHYKEFMENVVQVVEKHFGEKMAEF